MSSTSQGLDRKDLSLTGSVIGRSRRKVGENETEVVTYRITDGFITYNVSHWNPDDYFAVGSTVCLPVSVRTTVRNNHVLVNYVIRQAKNDEEEF